MERTCPACGADTGDGATVCPACGLALGAAEPAESDVRPEHVAVLMGAAPVIVSAASAASAPPDETDVAESPAASPHGVQFARSTMVAVLVLVAIAALVALVVVTQDRRDDAASRAERAYRALAHDDLLEPVELGPFDPDAPLASIVRDADALADARAVHRPLDRTPEMSIHDFVAAFDERLVELMPAWAIGRGRRPSARREGTGVAGELAVWLVMRDAWQTLRDWPEAASLSLHDRIDREALLGWLEASVRCGAIDRSAGLLHLHVAFDPLVTLREGSRPVSERCDDALVYLDDLESRLTSSVADAVEQVSSALVEAVAERIDDGATYLETYADWPGLDDDRKSRLTARLLAVRDVAVGHAARLRMEVAPRAQGAAEAARAAFAARLVQHGLDPVPHRTYAAVLECAAESLAEVLACAPAVEKWRGWVPPPSVPSFLDELRLRTPAWIGLPAESASPRVAQAPSVWSAKWSGGWYASAAGDEGSPTIYLAVDTQTGGLFERAYSAITLRHVLAHEGYPGHRLHESVGTCVVRDIVADPVTVEGWAVYAEDLLHEDGPCAEPILDAHLRAWSRWSAATYALDSILLACGARADVVRELRRLGDVTTPEEDVGDTALFGVRALGYVLGPPAIRRLRAREEARLGDRFDAKAFHLRFLRAGPIPIYLIEKEWDEEDAAR